MPTTSRDLIPIPAKTGPLFWAVLTGFLLISASLAFSSDCYAPSPSFSGNHTPYDKLNVRDLTQSEQTMLETLFKSLKGRWKGNGDGLQCRGNIDSPSPQHSLFSIQAEGKVDYDGNLALKIKLHSTTDESNRTKMIRFFLIDNKLRFESHGRAGDVELIELAKNKVEFLQRGRGGPGTLHREIFISLIAARNGFTFEKKLYTQGQFTFGRVLHFKR